MNEISCPWPHGLLFDGRIGWCRICNMSETERMDQEMMGWHDPKIAVTMTCYKLCTPHNIVNTGPPTTGASSAACKYHLRSSCKPWFAPGGRSPPLHPFPPQIPFIFAVFCINGNLRGNGCSGHDRPPGANHPPSIVIFTIAIGGDEAPVVGIFIFTRGAANKKNSCHPIISWLFFWSLCLG